MLKVIKRTLFISFLFLFVTAFSSTAYAATTLYVNANNVNVRSTPSTSTKDNIIGKANKGDACTFISEEDDWTKITINKKQGYIKSEYLQTEKITGKAATKNSSVKSNNNSSEPVTNSAVGITYVYNKNTGKFHVPTCSSVGDMKAKNREDLNCTRDELLALHPSASPCKRCHP